MAGECLVREDDWNGTAERRQPILKLDLRMRMVEWRWFSVIRVPPVLLPRVAGKSAMDDVRKTTDKCLRYNFPEGFHPVRLQPFVWSSADKTPG